MSEREDVPVAEASEDEEEDQHPVLGWVSLDR